MSAEFDFDIGSVIGPQGDVGPVPEFSIGTVTTGAAGSSAAATITGTDEAPVLNLTIPQGVAGEMTAASVAPVYSSSATYTVGDYVTYSGQLYRCTTAITTAEEWTSGHWTAAAIAPVVSDLNNQTKSYISSINGDNVFVAAKTTDGQALTATGTISNNNAAYISDYFLVIPNGKYELSQSYNNNTFANAIVYNESKEIVLIVDGATKTFTVPSNGSLVRVSGIITNKNNQALKYINSSDEQIDAKISDGLNTLIGSDLFIAANAETGKFFNTIGNETTNSAGYISDYIRVIPGAEYAMLSSIRSSSNINAVFYDKDKNKISSSSVVNGTVSRFTIPENCGFVRLNGLLANISAQGFFLVSYDLENACAGKTCICYGDSLTEYDGRPFTTGEHEGETCVGFESYMRSDLKMSWVFNRGGSGMTTPEFVARMLSEKNNLANYDYMTVMGGDNDDRLDVVVGSLAAIGSTFDTDTVYGALQEAVEQALAVNPLLRIVFMTEPMGWTGRTVDGTQKLVRVQEKYPQAYRDVANLYGLPLIDLWATSGINEFNRNQLYADVSDATNTSYMYHPYNNGWKRLSQLICMAFRHFE